MILHVLLIAAFAARFDLSFVEPQSALQPCARGVLETNAIPVSGSSDLDVIRAAGTGVPAEAVYIACTHTHTAPSIGRAADSYEISVEGPAAYDEGANETDSSIFASDAAQSLIEALCPVPD